MTTTLTISNENMTGAARALFNEADTDHNQLLTISELSAIPTPRWAQYGKDTQGDFAIWKQELADLKTLLREDRTRTSASVAHVFKTQNTLDILSSSVKGTDKHGYELPETCTPNETTCLSYPTFAAWSKNQADASQGLFFSGVLGGIGLGFAYSQLPGLIRELRIDSSDSPLGITRYTGIALLSTVTGLAILGGLCGIGLSIAALCSSPTEH